MDPSNSVDQQASASRQVHFNDTYSGYGTFHSNPFAYGDGDIILQDSEDDTGAPVQAADTRTHYINFLNALTSREEAESFLFMIRNRVATLKSEDDSEGQRPSGAQQTAREQPANSKKSRLLG